MLLHFGPLERGVPVLDEHPQVLRSALRVALQEIHDGGRVQDVGADELDIQIPRVRMGNNYILHTALAFVDVFLVVAGDVAFQKKRTDAHDLGPVVERLVHVRHCVAQVKIGPNLMLIVILLVSVQKALRNSITPASAYIQLRPGCRINEKTSRAARRDRRIGTGFPCYGKISVRFPPASPNPP